MIDVSPGPATAAARPLPMTRTTGLLLAAGTATISGISVFINATAVKHVPDPAVFTTLKNTVALVALVTLAGLTVRPSDVRDIRRSDRVRMTIIGIVGGGLAFLLFFSGLALASAPTAAFIHKTMFIWVALMAGPVLGERLGWIPIAALGVLLAGQVMILPPLGISWGTGETLIALATLLWAGEVILAKQVLRRVRSPLVGVGRLGIGLLVLIGFLAVTGRIVGIAALSGTGWVWVAITGLLLFGYVATWFAALRRAPATEVTSILVAGALVTGTLTAISAGTLPQPPVIGGFVMVALAAVVLAVVGTRRPLAALDA
jgi:drug/metabolite transporter (DMT)-like permease